MWELFETQCSLILTVITNYNQKRSTACNRSVVDSFTLLLSAEIHLSWAYNVLLEACGETLRTWTEGGSKLRNARTSGTDVLMYGSPSGCF